MSDHLAPPNAAQNETQDELTQFIYIISHDMRSPVRLMSEFSKILLSEHGEQMDEESKELLELMTENGNKLQGQLDGLLRYSRLNTSTCGYEVTNINSLITTCLAYLGDKIKACGAECHIGPMPKLSCRPELISILMQEIIDNGLKFHNQGQKPIITLSAKEGVSDWHFSVADNGIGIEPQYYAKVFKLFQRLHADDDYPGIGMGLTLAQKIVALHDGRIWIEPNTGSGTVIHFTLPK